MPEGSRKGPTRPSGRGKAQERQPAKAQAKRPTKKPTNLTLDPEAVARGERFGQRHGTSLSQLVTGFLYALPDADASLRELAPPVRRLYGSAAGGAADRDSYHAHLSEKYGGR